MKTIILTTGTILLFAAMPVLAQTPDQTTATTTTAQPATTTTTTQSYNPPPEQTSQSAPRLYQANEVSVDLFGTDALGQHTINHPSEQRILHHSTLGAGVGLNYFFLRYLGIGGEGYTENTAHNFVDDADGNLILRIPLGETGLAPYAYGGGGHKFDPINTSYAQLGGGLEFRFIHNFGVFVDGRYVYADKIRDYGLARAGFRLAF